MTLTLTCNVTGSLPIEWCGLTPDTVRDKSLAQIERCEVLFGNQKLPLADVFKVRGKPTDVRWELEGDFSHVHDIGAGMASGHIHIHGPAGRHIGSRMQGGEIHIDGDTGDFLGAEMRGGLIHAHGNAGNLVGAAYRGAPRGMTGGVILVDGDCGSEVGAVMRRGVIAIGGNAGDLVGRNLLAGTVVVCGACGGNAGVGLHRGTLALLGAASPALPGGYKFACTSRITVFPLVLCELQRRGFKFEASLLTAACDVYNGDLLTGGRSEILRRHAP